MIRSLLVATACAAFFSVLPASAQTSDFSADVNLASDSRLVRRVGMEDLKAIVVVRGDTILSLNTEDGPLVNAETDDGFKYSVRGSACGTQGCLGVNFSASYSKPQGLTDAIIAVTNQKRAAVSTWRSGNGLGFNRYIILDGGQMMENVKANLDVFVQVAPIAYEDLTNAMNGAN